MEPQIQYCTTSDGVSIGYAREGSGRPFVMMPNLWANVGFWHHVTPTLLTANAARGWETILEDSRGTGSSQRDVPEVSLETRILDLEAVVDYFDLPPFILMGASHGGPPAIAYAARHPDRVSALILANTYANGGAYYTLAPVMRALQSIAGMALDQWEFYTRTAANAVLGYSQPELAEKLALVYRESITPEMLIKYREASRATDVTAQLASVACPTVVIEDHASPLSVTELTRALASGIPGARLSTYKGGGAIGGEGMQRVIDQFFGVVTEPGDPTAPAQATTTAAITAILFTDIAGSTALTERMGDTAFRDASRTLDARLRATVRECGGTPIEGKVLGDGVMAVFSSASQAIEAANRCLELSAASELELHIGVHAGDVLHEADNVYGGAVNIASRICGLSRAGEVLVSATIRDLARTSSGVMFEDRGEHELKGIAEPLRVFAVRVAGNG